MDFITDIIHYSIPFTCNQCIYNKNCYNIHFKKENKLCYKFVPHDVNSFLNNAILYFRMNYPKSKDKKLKRTCNYNGAYNDRVTTLGEYYVNFINDCINELHKGNTVYVFKISHIQEIVKFYSDVTATYVGDGIIALKGDILNKSKKHEKR